jgi:hypothetical protein
MESMLIKLKIKTDLMAHTAIRKMELNVCRIMVEPVIKNQDINVQV